MRMLKVRVLPPQSFGWYRKRRIVRGYLPSKSPRLPAAEIRRILAKRRREIDQVLLLLLEDLANVL